MKNPSLPFDQGRALARLQQFWHRNFGALVCALALAGLTAFALGDTLTFARGGAGSWYDGVLRLHILANSDSEEDQALKLKVRDRVLQTAREAGIGGRLRGHRQPGSPGAADAARTAGRRAGGACAKRSDDAVTACITTMYFDTREYEGFTMPAGGVPRGALVDWRGQGAQLVVRAVPADVPAGCFRGGAGGPRLHHPGAAGAHRMPAV